MKKIIYFKSSWRKFRKAHFAAYPQLKYKLMSAAPSKYLRKKHAATWMPALKDDEI